MEIGSNLAVVGAFIFAGITFVFSYGRSRRNEQVKIISDIEKDFAKIEEKMIEVLQDDKKRIDSWIFSI